MGDAVVDAAALAAAVKQAVAFEQAQMLAGLVGLEVAQFGDFADRHLCLHEYFGDSQAWRGGP